MKLNQALHQGPRLLVPIHIDGMVVDDDLLRIMKGDWARNKAEYNNVVKQLGPAFPREIAVARSNKFYPSAREPEKGVHLQWVLPKGLRHGRQNEQHEIEFPIVPNRWLVIRTCFNAQHQLKLNGWLVQSDYVRKPSKKYKGPFILNQENDQIKLQQIGKVIAWENWNGESAYKRTKLTALGPEDWTFSSYTVNNKNVFSFHDDLQDLPSEKEFSLGYLITGWYSEPSEDPLFQNKYDKDQTLEKIEELGFDIGGEEGLRRALKAFVNAAQNQQKSLSPLMLCHGSIHSIQWPWSSSQSKDGRPQPLLSVDDTIPDIIVGNSGFDTLVTFIGQKLKEYGLTEGEVEFASELLYAFDQKLLNEFVQPDGENLLNANIHKNWFIGSAGSSFWEIVQNRVGNDEEEKNLLKTLMKRALPLLAELNSIQKQYDDKQQLKNSRLQHLYTALYAAKKVKSKAWQKKARHLQHEIQSVLQLCQSLEAQLEEKISEIKEFLQISEEANQQDDFNLNQRQSPNYWEPDDPVILVHSAKTKEKYTYKNCPTCRYSGQWIDKLSIPNTKMKLPPGIDEIPNAKAFPKELKALIKEFILLNPNYTQHLFIGQDLEKIRKHQTLIWNTEKFSGLDTNALMQQAGYRGIHSSVEAARPDFRSFTTFTLPWSPLFMDWVVYFFPNLGKKTIADSQCSDALKHWQLLEDQMDYSRTKDAPVPPIDDRIKQISWTIQGRSLLSSQLPQILIGKLKIFKEELTDPKQQESIHTIIKLLEGFDLLTQKLNGFNEYQQRYDIANQIPFQLLKDKDIDASLFSKQNFGLPLGKTVRENHVPINQYYPLRSGHLLVHHLRLVDDFGIGFYPVGYNEPVDKDNVLIPQDNRKLPKGKGMNNPDINNTGLVLLPPRISQPARLMMEWTDAENDAPVTQEAENSPVCGWIIPNHLDKSLMIFDALGKLQGSLIFFKRGDRFHVRKILDPVSANPSRFEIQNPHLNAFINGLLNLEEQDTALSGFLEQIDKSTWVTDPLGARDKRGLSALIGRPMVLLRARVRMDLLGLPLPQFDFQHAEQYDISSAANPQGLLDQEFPFFVGSSIMPNNGLIGYFDEVNGQTSYDSFYVVTDHSSKESAYIRDQQVLKAKLNHVNTPNEEIKSKHLSLLMDYRGIIHLISGLLPVFELSLPPKFTRDALANMEVTFRTGPLMTDPAKLRMPKPDDIRGKLSWIYQSGLKIWNEDQALKHPGSWENKDIARVLTNAHYPQRRNQLSEGWLKLSEAMKEK